MPALRSFHFIAFILSVILLSGCAETQLVSHWAKKVTWPGQQESKGKYKVGNPYKVGKIWYYPSENFQLTETGIASWYGPGFHAENTANGEIFDQNELTAAHRTLQLPSLVRVTNLENGRSVVVRVNDRGPFKNGRIMDVSMRAAELLGFINKGTARVRLEVLEKESRILARAAKRGEDTTRLTLQDLRSRQDIPENVINPPPIPGVTTIVRAELPPVKTDIAETGTDTSLPESLQTPTITVEELSREGTFSDTAVRQPGPRSAKLAAGRLEEGRFMPAPVVSKSPVQPTGIFVQAGSFSVYDNAVRLTKRLAGIAPITIDPVTINARQFYRVKLGPIDTVAEADSVLEKVIRTGHSTAKVVKN